MLTCLEVDIEGGWGPPVHQKGQLRVDHVHQVVIQCPSQKMRYHNKIRVKMVKKKENIICTSELKFKMN